MKNEFFTIDEFAEILRVHPQTIRRSIKIGKIRAFRINPGTNSSWRIHKSEIERMAEFDLKKIIDKTIDKIIEDKENA